MLQHMMDSSAGLDEQSARAKLAQFGLHSDLAALSVAALSGGQRARLVFAMLCVLPPHVLLLDEPETHLDLLTVAQLAESLTDWNAALVMITHDEYLAAVCDDAITVGEE